MMMEVMQMVKSDILKAEPTEFANKLDTGYKTEESRMTPRLLNWEARRMEAPPAEMQRLWRWKRLWRK